MCYIKEPTIIYILVFLQAKKAAAINGQPSSTSVPAKTELTPSKTSSPKTPIVKKEPVTTPVAKKEPVTTPVAKNETKTTPVIKKDTTPVVVKTEPKSESSTPKRKSKNVDSDEDDIPLVC